MHNDISEPNMCLIVAQARLEPDLVVCKRWDISLIDLSEYRNKVNRDVTLQRVMHLAIDEFTERWTTNAEEFMLVGFEKLTQLIREVDDFAMIPVIADSMAALNELVTSGKYLKQQRKVSSLEKALVDDDD
jgi:hypothetical protein